MGQRQPPKVIVERDESELELVVWARLYVQHLMTVERIASMPAPLKVAS